MSTQQKRAWFSLAVCGVALLGFVLFCAFVRVSLAPFAVCALWVLEPLLFRKKPIGEEPIEDERDKMIMEKAVLAAGASSYVAFILACIIPWGIIYMRGTEKLIHVDALPSIILAGAFAFFAAKSVTILVMYGREETRGQD